MPSLLGTRSETTKESSPYRENHFISYVRFWHGTSRFSCVMSRLLCVPSGFSPVTFHFSQDESRYPREAFRF